jgi:hypothetical protein
MSACLAHARALHERAVAAPEQAEQVGATCPTTSIGVSLGRANRIRRSCGDLERGYRLRSFRQHEIRTEKYSLVPRPLMKDRSLCVHQPTEAVLHVGDPASSVYRPPFEYVYVPWPSFLLWRTCVAYSPQMREAACPLFWHQAGISMELISYCSPGEGGDGMITATSFGDTATAADDAGAGVGAAAAAGWSPIGSVRQRLAQSAQGSTRAPA